jgi:hypothetical protein
VRCLFMSAEEIADDGGRGTIHCAPAGLGPSGAPAMPARAEPAYPSFFGHRQVLDIGRAARARYPEAWDVSRPCIGLEGARRTALLYSLVQSCALVGVPPFDYLKDVLVRVATHPQRFIHQLTPKGWLETFRKLSTIVRHPRNAFSVEPRRWRRRPAAG